MRHILCAMWLGNCLQNPTIVNTQTTTGPIALSPCIASSPIVFINQSNDTISSASESGSSEEELVYPRPRSFSNDSSDFSVEADLQSPFPCTRSTKTPDSVAGSALVSMQSFESLAEMMSNLDSNDPIFIKMKQFIVQSIKSSNCSTIILCHRYPRQFICNEHGHLTQILFGYFKLSGHFELSAIPKTVTHIVLSRNQLDSIGDFDDLKGTSLKYLHLMRNNKLHLNLMPLENKQDPLPLIALSVSVGQIAQYLKVRRMIPNKWMKTSSLRELKIVTGSKQLIRIERNHCRPFLVRD